MPLWFSCDGGTDRGFENGVIVTGPHGRAQIGHILLAQAHIKLTRAGQTHPVAAFAKIVT